ncbi:MAG TPA: 2-hydroxyacid dehydrogenase [Coleofasciculaceae cyanobacterium]|jgi:D-lactate dehydrogenase
MKIAVFSAKPYDEDFFRKANEAFGHELFFFESHLNEKTVQLAAGFPAVCVFPNDNLNRAALKTLASHGTKIVALRCAGYNNVDLAAANDFNMTVVRVPAYSPYSVAEHTVGLMLALNRKLCKANSRVREGNFTIGGLLGFDMHGKTVGIIGTGRIGSVVATILGKGFGCRVLAYDPSPNLHYEEQGVCYTGLDQLFSQSDIITLHCPLTAQTHHLIDEVAIAKVKPGVMLINTSRGGVIDTKAVIKGLKSGKIGSLGLDVYEEESNIFFEDFSGTGISDDVLARLMTFPNVMITSHQAFFTREALENIAQTTLGNVANLELGMNCPNEVPSPT